MNVLCCNSPLFELIDIPLCQTPSAASDSTSEPEAIIAPVPSEPPPPTTSLNSYYNTAPCLPPYSAHDLQVQSHFEAAALHDEKWSQSKKGNVQYFEMKCPVTSAECFNASGQ